MQGAGRGEIVIRWQGHEEEASAELRRWFSPSSHPPIACPGPLGSPL
ncbi:hypothetical protein D187_000331 [Cystobacter fuscus DSM 2262]|uniref:Uncharacterized protein n=1 Tax=Cystobacter fuscus (strain ATCC 25194 / DSM 2262 / NBRC 100088 / M29) TaxID=1242864 RepID=S9R786_CYSF2|nr:hypothetical protein D187_000331 [Cystobacter fuscus DSM 2262]